MCSCICAYTPKRRYRWSGTYRIAASRCQRIATYQRPLNSSSATPPGIQNMSSISIQTRKSFSTRTRCSSTSGVRSVGISRMPTRPPQRVRPAHCHGHIKITLCITIDSSLTYNHSCVHRCFACMPILAVRCMYADCIHAPSVCVRQVSDRGSSRCSLRVCSCGTSCGSRWWSR